VRDRLNAEGPVRRKRKSPEPFIGSALENRLRDEKAQLAISGYVMIHGDVDEEDRKLFLDVSQSCFRCRTLAQAVLVPEANRGVSVIARQALPINPWRIAINEV